MRRVSEEHHYGVPTTSKEGYIEYVRWVSYDFIVPFNEGQTELRKNN